METLRRYQLTNLAIFAVAVVHALATWSLRSTAALFVGGAVIAFVLEALAISLGVLEHNLEPQIAGVPASIVLAWPAIVYVAYRVALLAVPPVVPAAALAAIIATAVDVLTDPDGVSEGVWRYPESRFSSPRYRGVPWWNFLAWLAIVFATATLPALVGPPA